MNAIEEYTFHCMNCHDEFTSLFVRPCPNCGSNDVTANPDIIEGCKCKMTEDESEEEKEFTVRQKCIVVYETKIRARNKKEVIEKANDVMIKWTEVYCEHCYKPYFPKEYEV